MQQTTKQSGASYKQLVPRYSCFPSSRVTFVFFSASISRSVICMEFPQRRQSLGGFEEQFHAALRRHASIYDHGHIIDSRAIRITSVWRRKRIRRKPGIVGLQADLYKLQPQWQPCCIHIAPRVGGRLPLRGDMQVYGATEITSAPTAESSDCAVAEGTAEWLRGVQAWRTTNPGSGSFR